MRRSGFTIVELAIVISILALVVPGIYLFARTLDEQHALGLWHLDIADSVRTIGEELRADAQVAQLGPGQEIRFEKKGPCSPVEYRLTPERTLVRYAPERCEPQRALATRIAAIHRVAGGVELSFFFGGRPDGSHQSVVFIPVGR